MTWKGLTPPGPPRRATPSLLRKLVVDRLALMSQASAQYGAAARVAIGPKTLYLFNHPEHARHVLADNAANYHKGIGLQQAKRALGDGLLTSEGALWKEQRKIIRPVFQARKVAAQDEVVADEAAKLVARLRAHRGAGPVDVVHEMTSLTLGVLGRSLLESDLTRFPGIGEAFEAIQDQAMFEMVTLGMVPTWLPLPKQLRFRRARRLLQEVVDTLVAERSSVADEANDVVSRLIRSTREETDPAVARDRMRDELVTLLLAGHETTASTLSWTFHLVDQHPEVGERLREEALTVLGPDRLPTNADLGQLRYTAMVVHEVMRLYPPVWILTRQALQDDEIGGYHVPAGADVLVCPYTLHRNPEFWPDPETFDPERFDPSRARTRPSYAYIPFGAGPRFCVGNNLGLMEAMFVTAMISRELKLTGAPGHRVVPEPMLSLRAKGGLPMIVEDAPVREPAPA